MRFVSILISFYHRKKLSSLIGNPEGSPGVIPVGERAWKSFHIKIHWKFKAKPLVHILKSLSPKLRHQRHLWAIHTTRIDRFRQRQRDLTNRNQRKQLVQQKPASSAFETGPHLGCNWLTKHTTISFKTVHQVQLIVSQRIDSKSISNKKTLMSVLETRFAPSSNRINAITIRL